MGTCNRTPTVTAAEPPQKANAWLQLENRDDFRVQSIPFTSTPRGFELRGSLWNRGHPADDDARKYRDTQASQVPHQQMGSLLMRALKLKNGHRKRSGERADSRYRLELRGHCASPHRQPRENSGDRRNLQSH